jgi:hypothetical protein
MGWKANRMGDAHITDQIQKVNSELPKELGTGHCYRNEPRRCRRPRHDFVWPNAKFILACPAWKVFNVKPNNLPSDTIIIQGDKDGQVPPADSEELSKMTGLNWSWFRAGTVLILLTYSQRSKQHTSVIKPGLAKKWKERRKEFGDTRLPRRRFQQLQKFTPPKPSLAFQILPNNRNVSVISGSLV